MLDTVTIPLIVGCARLSATQRAPGGYIFLHPTYGNMERSAGAIIISVHIPESRPMSEKRVLLKEIVQRLHANVGTRPDDVFITLIPLPSENFSFGRGLSAIEKGDD